MPEDFKYKEYTTEEDKIHNDAITKIREGLKNGLNFNEACSVVELEDAELKKFIIDDALKIMIAELHYSKGMPLPQVANTLRVPMKDINIANMEMLEDVGITAAELYKKSNPDNPFGNA
jgi:hypothetical protein